MTGFQIVVLWSDMLIWLLVAAGVGVLILFRHRSSIGGINIIGLEVQDRTGFRAGWTMMILSLIHI